MAASPITYLPTTVPVFCTAQIPSEVSLTAQYTLYSCAEPRFPNITIHHPLDARCLPYPDAEGRRRVDLAATYRNPSRSPI